MKLIRFIVISVVVIFAIASFIGLLLPSTVLVSRAVNVSAPKDSIIRYVNDIWQWKEWMEGFRDPSVIIQSASFAEMNGTKVSITGLSDSTVRTVWTTRKGNFQIATMQLIGSPGQNITVVQWQFEEKLNWYPWERLGSMMNDKIIGPMMETNLNNLKKLAEKN
ncbi:MAG: hypothetical protein M0Q26_06700 [Chitinophagaceae bacterium]|nr:hypothetical protein [Chitinophagaceae bacterium]MDP1811447.1 hypothetical protein [Sediminibacterium sp.]MDP3127205.1 hypothetical protein [Sediminibacterium sp.]